MKTVLARLVILACAFGVFILITLILREDVPMPDWVPFDLHKSVWLAPVLKLFGVLLLAPPFARLVASLMVLGSAPGWQAGPQPDEKGVVQLRLMKGPKYTAIGLCLTVFGAIIFALIWQEEPSGIWLFVSPLLLALLYGLVLCFAVRAQYDQRRVAALYYGLRWRENRWADLSGVAIDSSAGDIILRFGDRGSLRLSAYYDGIGGLLRHANAILERRRHA